MTFSTSVERRRRFARRALLSVTTILAAGAIVPARAQTTPGQVYSNVDANGVDLVTGSFNFSHTDLSIGPNWPSGLQYTTVNGIDGFTDSLTGAVSVSTSGEMTKVYVTQGTSSDLFQQSGSTFTSLTGRGATLSAPTGTTYLYTLSNGTQIGLSLTQPEAGNWISHINYFQYPDGRKVSLSYASYGIPSCPQFGCAKHTVERLASVVTSDGYQLIPIYATNGFPTVSNSGAWQTRTAFKAVNRTIEYCQPTFVPCSLTGSWAQVTFATNGSQKTVTDSNGNSWTYTFSGLLLTGVRRPGASSDDIGVSYDTSSRVKSITRSGSTWTYGYVDTGTQRTSTVTDSLSHVQTIVADLNLGEVTSVTDAVGQTTSYQYDGSGRVSRITRPEQNYTSFSYDTRGNVTEQRQVSKTPGTPADVVTSASYPTSCTNVVTCNEPTWAKDANGNQTDYTYDSTHGGVLTVTAPTPTSGAVRPQTRYVYTPLQAYVKDSSGSTSASGVTEYRLTSTSTCRTQASCAGTADEVLTTTSYGPQASGTANNLLPISSAVGAGDGSLAATSAVSYDNVGNALTTTDALGNVTGHRYDAAREMVGTVGPDPDGAGGNPNPAVRMTYNADGQVTLTEQGTVASQSDGDWANFSSLHQVATVYDGNGRKVQDTAQAGGATSSLVQYSYDGAGRLDCTALRMNPAAYSSLPGACTLGTQGSFGPDRISRNQYDALSRVNETWNGYGTASASASQASYTPNGKVGSVTDENGNVTTYAFDGFDRLYRTYYPNPTGSGSSTGDYQEVNFDPAGNLTRHWLRGTGNHQDITYDALNRPTGITVPHINATDKNTSYAYDNLGEVTYANEENNNWASFAYDALGRKVSEGSAFGGTKTFGYDLAGRRTKLTWQDGFYVTYGYDNDGRMTGAFDNSGAQLFSLGYSGDGSRTSLCPNGNGAMCAQYGYDTAGRLNALTLAGTSGTSMTFGGYNPAGQIGQRQNSNDAYAWTGAANANKGYVVNGLNQYTSVAGVALGYDPHGNLTSLNGSSYGYDSFNRLGEYNGGYNAGNWFYFDGLGRLEWSNATQTRLDYDGSRLITELDGNNNISRRYVYGPNPDEPVVWYEGAGTGDKRFLQTDERGSVARVQRADGSTLAINSYDEYGNPGSGNQGRFGYTGQTWLPEIGLWYYKARMYAPQLGRFMQTDPIGYGDGLNWHAYAHADPVNGSDSSGTWSHPRLHGILNAGGNGNEPDAADGNPAWADLDSMQLGQELQAEQDQQIAASQAQQQQAWNAWVGHQLGSDFEANYTQDTLQDAGLLSGNHDYIAGPNLICPASWGCSAALVGSLYSEINNAIPGNSSTGRIVSGGTYTVSLFGVPVGQVQSYVGSGGLTVNNITYWDHVLAMGWANRNAFQVSGNWYSFTHGSGTNYYGGAFMATVNQLSGRPIFNGLDSSIESQLYAATHH